MKYIIGVILILAGAVAGIYLGIWIMFIGGIIQAVEAFKLTPIDSMEAAIGVAKILFSGGVGWFSFYLLALPGIHFITSDK